MLEGPAWASGTARCADCGEPCGSCYRCHACALAAVVSAYGPARTDTLVGLGAWRLSAMLVYEDGPWDLFARLRLRAGLRAGAPVEGLLPGILNCIWCSSVWVASGLWALSELHPLFAAVPAAWALAVIADRMARGDR